MLVRPSIQGRVTAHAVIRQALVGHDPAEAHEVCEGFMADAISGRAFALNGAQTARAIVVIGCSMALGARLVAFCLMAIVKLREAIRVGCTRLALILGPVISGTARRP